MAAQVYFFGFGIDTSVLLRLTFNVQIRLSELRQTAKVFYHLIVIEVHSCFLWLSEAVANSLKRQAKKWAKPPEAEYLKDLQHIEGL
jgi:hypothetical protein